MSAAVMADAALEQALEAWDDRFDGEAHLVRGTVGAVRYHTRLAPGTPVHPTRESAQYAAALLESEDPARHERAARVLRRLLSLQDAATESRSCGIWPWFHEEPLEQMAPPDWNWADFIGAQLAQMLARNSRRLPDGLAAELRESLRLAARSIRKRDVRLSYTNIAIMGTYVTVMAGTLLGDAEILAYGKDRLRRFVEFTRGYGGFPEYNSPDYMVVSLTELSRMLRDFTDEGDRLLAREVHDRAWEDIAYHWHGPSGQWAGPHSRSYSTLLKPEIRAFIQRGLGGRAAIAEGGFAASLEELFLPVRCPDRLAPYFSEKAPRRDLASGITEEAPQLEARMHMEPGFVLSSVERGTFWNQARGLIAYAPSAGGAVAMTVRFLHDTYDFAAANLLCCQEKNRVLAGICLAHDRGDKHPELDPWAGRRIRAADWRLRVEFLNVRPEALPRAWSFGQAVVLPFGREAWLGLVVSFAQFGPFQPRLETGAGADGDRCWVDLVFYSGAAREFHFDDAFAVCAGLALAIGPTEGAGREAAQAEAAEEPAAWTLSMPGLRLAVPKFPAKESEIVSFVRRQKS